MISAAVGFQCPDCVHQGAVETRQNQLPFGGHLVRHASATTIALIGMNVAVWLAILATGGASSRLVSLLSLTRNGLCWSSTESGSYYPDVHNAAVCAQVPDGNWTSGAFDGAWWQVITSGFTHVDVMHIGLNMLTLWFLGPPLERILGRARFLAVYLLSLLAGSVGVLWFSGPSATTLGASGAIFGLLGALLVLTIRLKADTKTLLIWLGINVVYTVIGPGVSWQAHLGGLLGGIITTGILVLAPRERRGPVQVLGLLGFALLMCVLIGVAASSL